MDFINKCKEKLLKMNHEDIFCFQNESYISFENLRKLPEIIKTVHYFDELLITPFYFTKDSRLELYDYALMIRVSDNIRSQEEIILKITGKDSVESIDNVIFDKLKNTQFEILTSDKNSFVNSLEQYIYFIQKNHESLLKYCREYTGKEEVGIYFEIA
jgi:hypothetical protein